MAAASVDDPNDGTHYSDDDVAALERLAVLASVAVAVLVVCCAGLVRKPKAD